MAEVRRYTDARANPGKWWKEFRAQGFPGLTRGDIFLSHYDGTIGRLIGKFQGRPGPDDQALQWSHTGVYIGGGMVAEATFPRGGVNPLLRYISPSHRLRVYHVWNWEIEQRALVASEATRLAMGKFGDGVPYDKVNIARHLVDNLFERLTWNAKKQSGWRPLSRIFKDHDGTERLVCSELVEDAVHFATGEKMQSGKVGQARPRDVWQWLALGHEAGIMLRSEFGKVTTHYVTSGGIA